MLAALTLFARVFAAVLVELFLSHLPKGVNRTHISIVSSLTLRLFQYDKPAQKATQEQRRSYLLFGRLVHLVIVVVVFAPVRSRYRARLSVVS